MEAFDTLRSGLTRDRSQCYEDLAPMFYGANRPGARVWQGTLDQFWLWSMQAGLKNAYESIKAFSENDQAIPSEAEMQFANRMGATIVKVPSSHVAMVFHPDEVVKLIKTAAETVQSK